MPSPKSARAIADILQKPKSTASDVIVKLKRRGSETVENEPVRRKYLLNTAAEL